MPSDKVADRKAAALRRDAAQARVPDPAVTIRNAIGTALHAHYGARAAQAVLAGYIPIRSEMSPLPAMEAHAGPVCVPVVTALHQPLQFYRWSPGAQMVEGRFGTRIPAIADHVVPDVLIVPLLAYDARGYRLGYGGGFYDRTLAQLRAMSKVLAIGLAYSAQQQDIVPTEPTDERLDLIVTEAGIFEP
jgi:5-formyltetrahydrofolate cyclo-ligase